MKSLYKTYREKPSHLNPNATKGMSFRALAETKLAIGLLAKGRKTSLTKIILASLGEYLSKHQSEVVEAALNNSVQFPPR